MLASLLHNIDEVEVVGKYTNPRKALEELSELAIDVVFLDMEMADLHGLEFAEILAATHPQIEIVFVTAHPQFAIEAFGVNTIDYLLKPIDHKRLAKTINKLIRRFTSHDMNQESALQSHTGLFARAMDEFSLFNHEGRKVKWRTKKVKELFILLWHHKDKGIHRSQIILNLWPELPESKAATLMHTTIYQLRKMLKTIECKRPIILKNEQYTLNISVKSDLDKLKNLMNASEAKESEIEEALKLYKGDYLCTEDYQWSLSARESVRRTFLIFLEKYIFQMVKDVQGNHLIEKCLQKMIELDPYNIQYTWTLLKYYGDEGKTKDMIKLFEAAKMKWIDELGLDMPQEIVDHYEEYVTYK